MKDKKGWTIITRERMGKKLKAEQQEPRDSSPKRNDNHPTTQETHEEGNRRGERGSKKKKRYITRIRNKTDPQKGFHPISRLSPPPHLPA